MRGALSRCGREVERERERERESPRTTTLPAEGRERPREPEDEMNGGRSWRGAPRRPVIVAAVHGPRDGGGPPGAAGGERQRCG